MDIILTQRDESILKCLVMCVRVLSLRQMAVHWWNGEMANARRRMKQLAEVRLVAAIEVLARPISSLDGPVTCWWPGSPEPDFGALSYLFQNRLRRLPSRMVKVYVASDRAAALFGGQSNGELSHPTQAGHDLGVAAIWLTLARTNSQKSERWIGEDRMANLRVGEKRPDAFIVNVQGQVESVIEFGGDYDRSRVEAFHRDCAERNLPYELW